MSLPALSLLFLGLTVAMSLAVLRLLSGYLDGRAKPTAIAIFVFWMLYVTALGTRGIIASKHPPGPVFFVVPLAAFVAIFLCRQPSARQFAGRIPVPTLVGLQVFRVFVEIGLYGLSLHRLVPDLMTFEGGNFDILTGLSAPLIAWLYARGTLNDRAVAMWSWIGIGLLANILARALLTFAGIIPTEVPNVAIGLFPFTYLPGFLAPLALCLHILLLRSLPRKTAP